MPSPETALARVAVADAMRTGIVSTDADTPLSLVARLMAERGAYAIAVSDPEGTRWPLEFVTALNICAAATSDIEEMVASDVAVNLQSIRSDEHVAEAAVLMVQLGVEHLLVINPASGRAEGIVSSLDVAAAYGRKSPIGPGAATGDSARGDRRAAHLT